MRFIAAILYGITGMIVLFILTALVGLVHWSVSSSSDEKAAVVTVENVDLAKITTTVGNYSFVHWPLFAGQALLPEQAKSFMNLIQRFKEARQELRVTGWRTQMGYEAYILGVWIDHEPRTPLVESR